MEKFIVPLTNWNEEKSKVFFKFLSPLMISEIGEKVKSFLNGEVTEVTFKINYSLVRKDGEAHVVIKEG